MEDYISELKKLRNNLKILNNENVLESLKIEKLYQEYSDKKIDLENEISDKYDLKAKYLSMLVGSTIMCSLCVYLIIKDNSNYPLFVLSASSFIYDLIGFIKSVIEENNLYDEYDDVEYKIIETTMNYQSKQSEIENMNDKIENISNVIDENNKEEAIKILSLEKLY